MTQAPDAQPPMAEVVTVLGDLAHLAIQAGSAAPDTLATIADVTLGRLQTLCAAQQGALLLGMWHTLAGQPPTPSPTSGLTLRFLARHDLAEEAAHALLAASPPPAQGARIVSGELTWLIATLPVGKLQPGQHDTPATLDQSQQVALLLLGWTTPLPAAQAAAEDGRALLPLVADAVGTVVTSLLLAERVYDLEDTLKRREALLREVQDACADWQQAFDAIADPVSIVTADYRLLHANAAYWHWYGLDHAQTPAIHRGGDTYHCFAVGPDRATPCAGCPLPRTIQTGRPGFAQQERLVVTGSGHERVRRIYQTWTYPVVNAAGTVERVVEFIKDVTEQERLRHEASTAEALREADRLKTELLGTISHELRSPLTAIKGYAATLRRHERRIPRAERQEFLRAIDEASDRLGGIVDRLLEMAQLEARTITIARMPVDIARLAQEAIAAAVARDERAEKAKLVWGHRPSHLTYTLNLMDAAGMPAQSAPLVLADPRRLREVLDNLLENAGNYSPNGGTVEITLQPVVQERAPESASLRPLQRQMLEIRVQDQGVGIPAEHLERVFDRFHRVDTQFTREVGGLGLGLAICKRIVELHDGTIWAESQPGGGSVFHVLLPIAERVSDEQGSPFWALPSHDTLQKESPGATSGNPIRNNS